MKDTLYYFKERVVKRYIDKIGLIIPYNSVKIENSIIISGSPRSGTTLFMEILGTLPRYKTIFEPFHIEFFPEFKEMKFSPKPYLPPTQQHPKLKEYLSRVLTGQVISTHPHYRLVSLDMFHRIMYTGVVAKFVRANRLLPWIAQNFNLRQIYVLLRHPCATISSQLRYRIYGYFTKPNIPSKEIVISEALTIPDIKENKNLVQKIQSIKTTEELLALSWTVDAYIPLKYSQKYDFSFIFYEDIITNPEKTLRRIFGKIGERIPKRAYKKIRAPSMLAYDYQKEQKKQLFKWKDSLSKEQVENILKVVHWFGIDFYTEDPEPDYNAFKSWKPPF